MMKMSRSSLERFAVSGRRLAAVLCALSLAFGAWPASAELRYTTVYREKLVEGTTPEQLWRYMTEHPIIDEDGPALANITHDHKLSVKTERSDGVCRVSNLDFTWNFVITLPKAVDEVRMTPAVRAMWREFTHYLKGHENAHRTIFIGCGRDFVPEAEKLTTRGPCFVLKHRVKQLVDKRYKACMAKQRAFDRDEHKSLPKLALHKASH